MNPSTKDQIEGMFHDMKGNIKKKVGKVTDNPKLTAQGQGEQFAGKVQKKAGQNREGAGKVGCRVAGVP